MKGKVFVAAAIWVITFMYLAKYTHEWWLLLMIIPMMLFVIAEGSPRARK